MMKSTKKNARCKIRLDRLVIGVADESPTKRTIKGFKVVKDTLVRPQGTIATYARVRRLRSTTNSCRVTIQHKKLAPWLPAAKITLIGDDRSGLTPEEVQKICSGWQNPKISLIELAFDFHPDTPVDEDYVLRHARFGKSRRRNDRGGPGQLRFGSRGSSKLVRCYWKEEIGRYRVELELHAPLLKKFSIQKTTDLPLIATKLWPAHFCFKVMRWVALEAHLVRRYREEAGKRLYEEAVERAETSLRRVNRFLSRAVHNPHRFWGSAVTNRDVREALQRWSAWFELDEEVFLATK